MGADSLTDSELLGIIIRTGTVENNSVQLAEKILSLKSVKNIGDIANISISDLKKIKGIGDVKAIQIKCIAELSRRIAKSSISLKEDFSSPELIANYYMEDLRHLKTEHFIMAMLNNKCCFIGDVVLSKGTVNSSIASTRETFIEALKNEAVNIVLIHNHPSGDPTPSKDDVNTTIKMKRAGDIIGIAVIDHIPRNLSSASYNKHHSLHQTGQ